MIWIVGMMAEFRLPGTGPSNTTPVALLENTIDQL